MRYKNLLAILIIFGFFVGLPVFSGDNTEAKLEYNKGIDFYKAGQYDLSMEAFRKAIDINPEYIDAYYNLGSILEYLGQDEAALTVFKQIVVRKPTDYDAVYKAAELSKKLGQPDKAKSFLALIPSSAKAQQLAHELNTDLQTIKAEQKLPDIPQASNGIYENIISPTGLTTDKAGNLYVASFSDNVVYKITTKGDRIVFLKDARLNGPIGLIGDESGNLYIANYNANNVLKIDSTGLVTVLISDVIKPYGLHVANGTLYISSQGDNAVIRYKL